MDPIAPGLQRDVSEFLQASGWTVASPDAKTLVAKRRIAGNEWASCFHFEDEQTLSQAGSPTLFARRLVEKGSQFQSLDLVVTEKTLDSGHWRDYIVPELDKALSGLPNGRYGTLTSFLDRFAREVADAFVAKIDETLKLHFVKVPVRPSFKPAIDALEGCATWVDSRESPRLMLVTGDAGAGKSVFALMVVRELRDRFLHAPGRNPAPFLISFTKGRPALIDDLIALTLNDLGLTYSITPTAIRFLLEKGRLVFIMDGFDEISRAMAHNAQENIDELSKNINRLTRGRLLLTARPSFVAQEELFGELKSSCEVDAHEEYELAPYSDSQMHEWVIRNPPEGALTPPERHWNRVDTAFRQNPDVKELCRTPVFLRMMSDVLVRRASVSSVCDLLNEFCQGLWERERSKRPLTLSDAQYFQAYEAIALAVEGESRVDPREIKSLLDLYFQEYSPELMAGLPGSASTLVEDLSIGPLTFKNGLFAFVHEVLNAYFIARMMVRSLAARRRVVDLWNRPLGDTVRTFLREVIQSGVVGNLEKEAVLREVAIPARDGLAVWNVVEAVGLAGHEIPRDVLREKRLAGVVFDRSQLDGMIFDDAELLDVVFDRCELRGASFKRTSVQRVKFIQCGTGVVVDRSLRVPEDGEVIIVRSADSGAESYAGEEALRTFLELGGEPLMTTPLPQNVAESAVVVIFGSLFKAGRNARDYPEWQKVENRVRGWVTGLGLEPQAGQALTRLLVRMAGLIRDAGWIQRNPNRPRTFVPSRRDEERIFRIMRVGRIEPADGALHRIVNESQAQIDQSVR